MRLCVCVTRPTGYIFWPNYLAVELAPPPPPLSRCYLLHTSNIGFSATHWSTVICLCPMYMATDCIPDSPTTSLAASINHIPSGFLCDRFPMIYHRKPVCIPSTLLFINAGNINNSKLNTPPEPPLCRTFPIPGYPPPLSAAS